MGQFVVVIVVYKYASQGKFRLERMIGIKNTFVKETETSISH